MRTATGRPLSPWKWHPFHADHAGGVKTHLCHPPKGKVSRGHCSLRSGVASPRVCNTATARITGPLAGYKAGLTNPAVQKRFHTDRPVWGSLGKSMLLTSPATVPAQFGARPVFEADLLVRVSSAAINQAKAP